MPSAITRVHKNRRSSRKNSSPNRPQPTTPITMISATPAGSVLTIVFNQPVILKGVPQYTTDVAGPPTPDPLSAAMTSPTTLALTFDAAVAAATEVNVPYEDPAIRNSSGGFVTPTAFKV